SFPNRSLAATSKMTPPYWWILMLTSISISRILRVLRFKKKPWETRAFLILALSMFRCHFSLSRLAGSFLFLFPQPQSKVTQSIHVIDKGLIGTFIRTEIRVDIAVRKELGTHIIEVVAGLQVL